jgi:SAM-dependent methyltransferase
MLLHPHCPTCRCANWRVLGEKTYRKEDSQSKRKYVQLRYRILFETWFPGVDEVRIESILCEQCGMLVYRPRPEALDLTNKYKRLLELNSNDRLLRSGNRSVDDARSNEVFRDAERMSGRSLTNASVLDFGGGDGCLMQSFLRHGCQCDLVDFVDTPLQGVRKICDTLEDLPSNFRYDCIIASHVLEHLHEPRDVLEVLRQHLNPDGILYLEVPFEVWGSPPLLEEPVTHLNFFTPSSLRFLIEASGLDVVECGLSTALHPTNRRFGAIKALACTPRGKIAKTQIPNLKEAEMFLSPNWFRRGLTNLYWLGLLGANLKYYAKQLIRYLLNRFGSK